MQSIHKRDVKLPSSIHAKMPGKSTFSGLVFVWLGLQLQGEQL